MAKKPKQQARPLGRVELPMVPRAWSPAPWTADAAGRVQTIRGAEHWRSWRGGK